MPRACSTLHDWEHLVRALHGFECIVAELQGIPEAQRVSILRRMVDAHDANTAKLLFLIESVVDFQASAASSRLVVRHGVSAKLDEYKRVYEGYVFVRRVRRVWKRALRGFAERPLKPFGTRKNVISTTNSTSSRVAHGTRLTHQRSAVPLAHSWHVGVTHICC